MARAVKSICTAAMTAAEDVMALDNDVELLTTPDECASADDWIATIKEPQRWLAHHIHNQRC